MLAIQFSVALGIMAGVVQLLGYWLYHKKAGGKVNTGSWLIWALGGSVDLASYFVLSGGDWIINILPIVCTLAALSTFVFCLVQRRFGWPDKTDWLFVGVDGVVTVVWYFTNAVTANLLYQVSTVLSFIPMYRGQLSGREKEEPLPWLVWALAYTLLIASVSLRSGRWEELMYPITHVIVHLLVVLFALVKKQSRGPRAHPRGPFCFPLICGIIATPRRI